MSFRVTGLNPAQFAPLFALTDAELQVRLAERSRVERAPGAPCRVSLDDAAPGEEVLLINYQHQPAATPFQSAHAIYVRRAARQALSLVDAMPPALARRPLSLRAFDEQGMIIDAALSHGAEASAAVESLFADERVAYIHAHYALLGCYAARIDRA